MERTAGILLPVASLPSSYGIGSFSQSAYAFVDWLRAAGQRFWQILPLGPTGFGDSPYQTFSVFAGNPYYISLEALTAEGLLTEAECAAADFGGSPGRVDYGALYRSRLPLLRRAWRRSGAAADPAGRRFTEDNRWWLEDYALFMAIKHRFGGLPWTQWPEDIRFRRREALAVYGRDLAEEICFQRFLQYQFFRQWQALKDYANCRGLQIIGDIPIYAALDSADVWARPELFQLDGQRLPTAVAGCPPDGFSAAGQLWGNPLYRWKVHQDSGFAWWLSRLRHCFQLYDVTRIDHFRGFDAYYSIPYGAPSAASGHWAPGPGRALFQQAEQVLGPHPVIAEDLGHVTGSARQLVQDCGFPGMKVLEFAFDARDTGAVQDHLPHNYPEHCVAYTGTHDNETLAGWLGSISDRERQAVRDYLCDRHTPRALLCRPLIALILRSRAKCCIVPIQDYLGLDNQARINRPASPAGNWRWRLRAEDLTPALQQELRTMAGCFGRLGSPTSSCLLPQRPPDSREMPAGPQPADS